MIYNVRFHLFVLDKQQYSLPTSPLSLLPFGFPPSCLSDSCYASHSLFMWEKKKNKKISGKLPVAGLWPCSAHIHLPTHLHASKKSNTKKPAVWLLKHQHKCWYFQYIHIQKIQCNNYRSWTITISRMLRAHSILCLHLIFMLHHYCSN